jgi:hypothetical protein
VVTLYAKRGDTARILQDQLLVNGQPINLTSCAVVLVGKRIDMLSAQRINATITSEALGEVQASLAALVMDEAVWELEWEVTFSNDLVLTFPANGYHTLKVAPDLG